MADKNYDKILTRLVLILTKLNANELPTLLELSEEFNVSLKTIQRDIYQRLILFPIEKDEIGHLRFMEGFNLGKSQLSVDEIITMSLSLDMIKDAGSEFKESARLLFAKMLHNNIYNPYYIKPPQYQTIDMDASLINQIEEAIETQTAALVKLDGKESEIEPYKITNIEGIWYLLAYSVEEQKIKTYLIANIETFASTEKIFVPKHDIERILPRIQSAFFDFGRNFEVIIKVYPRVAEYFKLKNHLPSQRIIEEKDDGSLIIGYIVSHEEDVDNLVKSWLPDIEVVEPPLFRHRILHELQEYLSRVGTVAQ